jgi:hypothetical protein
MANSTTNLPIVSFSPEGRIFDMPVDGGTHIYAGTLVCQLTATGQLVPYSTASSEFAIGVSQHETDNTSGADGATRCKIESGRVYAFTNGAGGDAFSDTSFIGAPVYGTDDHTVAKTSSTNTRKMVGFFYGFEADGKVRVLVDAMLNRLYAALAGLTDTPASADALRDDIVTKVAT